MQDLSLITILISLAESPYSVLIVCGILIFLISRLGYKNIRLDLQNSLDKKASKKDIDDLDDKINETNIELTLLKGKIDK